MAQAKSSQGSEARELGLDIDMGSEFEDIEVRHAMSLLGASANKKKCKEQEIVIKCKPQLVSCDPVVVVDDCSKVKIVIN